MSNVWSWFVIIGTVVTLLACFWLIVWTNRQRASDEEIKESEAHVWDEDVRELTVAIPVLIGTMFAGLVKFAVEPRQPSCFFALEGEKAIRKGMIVSTVTFGAVFTLLIPVGIYAFNIKITHNVYLFLFQQVGKFLCCYWFGKGIRHWCHVGDIYPISDSFFGKVPIG